MRRKVELPLEEEYADYSKRRKNAYNPAFAGTNKYAFDDPRIKHKENRVAKENFDPNFMVTTQNFLERVKPIENNLANIFGSDEENVPAKHKNNPFLKPANNKPSEELRNNFTEKKVQLTSFDAKVGPTNKQSSQSFNQTNYRKEELVTDSIDDDLANINVEEVLDQIYNSDDEAKYKTPTFSFQKQTYPKRLEDQLEIKPYNDTSLSSYFPLKKNLNNNNSLKNEIILNNTCFRNDKLTTKQFPLNIIITHPNLNPIQTICFELLANTDKHSLVTAPTGSGKTTLFEISIGRVIKQNIDQNNKYINTSFKIIYLAPIKSLCQEKYQEWRVKFSQLNLSVIEATGDSKFINQSQLQSANIILSTPERWDSITRKWKDYPLIISQIHLLLIDEIHLLNEEVRGGTLEAIVARMKLIAKNENFKNSPFCNFRIVALSATIPNIYDLAEWLSVDAEGLKIFGEEYRPVQIEKIVLGYNNDKNEYLFEKNLNFRLADLLQKYSDDRPSLVFCQTQKGTVTACLQLQKDTGRIFNITPEQKSELTHLANLVKDKQLIGLVKSGIAFHNASLTMFDRQLVEEYFKKGLLRVICTTSTLAQGVNLPARLVIIKSTFCYRGSTIGYTEYNKIEIDQMVGRAGRPQYDTKGIAIIMTEKHNVEKVI
jgi:superfamily II RNA helicase